MDAPEPHNKEFKTQLLGGYHKASVKTYLNEIAEYVADLEDKLSDLQQRTKTLETMAMANIEALEAAATDEPSIRFDALAELTDREIQLLLRNIDKESLLSALAGDDSEAFRDRVWRNVSIRAGDLLQADLNAMENLSKNRIRLGQKAVIFTALKLASEHKLMLPKSDVEPG